VFPFRVRPALRAKEGPLLIPHESERDTRCLPKFSIIVIPGSKSTGPLMVPEVWLYGTYS
jgi:hypothetical protein